MCVVLRVFRYLYLEKKKKNTGWAVNTTAPPHLQTEEFKPSTANESFPFCHTGNFNHKIFNQTCWGKKNSSHKDLEFIFPPKQFIK